MPDTNNEADLRRQIGDLQRRVAELEGALRERDRLAQEQTSASESLQETEERYRAVSELTSDYAYAFRVEPDGSLVREWVTGALVRIAGFTADELLARGGWESMIHPDDMSIPLGQLREVMAGRSAIVEYRILTKDGSVRWTRDYARPVWDEAQGRTTYIYGAIQDITERKQAEESLARRLEFERLISAMSSSFVGLSSAEIDSGIESALASVGAFSMADRAYVFLFRDGGALVDNTHEWCAEGIAPQIENLKGIELDGELPWFAERLRELKVFHEPNVADLPPEAWREREHFEAQSIKSLITVPMALGDRLVGFLGFDAAQERRDWTDQDLVLLRLVGETFTHAIERKRAENALGESQERLITILDSIDADVYVADMKTYEILFVNRHMRTGFGSDLIGRTCWKVFRKESGPCAICTNDQLVDAAGIPTGVVAWEGQNPITGKWYINYDRAIKWVDGRLVRLQAATDITASKRAEEERERLRARLVQAEKMESVGRLAGGVAHDFNNMLQAILGNVDLALAEASPSASLHEALVEIQKAAERSADLTRQLLAFARKQTIAPVILDLNDTVAGMLRMLRRLIGEDINLAWMPGADLWSVRMDPSQLDQMLANLCLNARDAISGVGRISIETRNVSIDAVEAGTDQNPGEYVMLAVVDDGSGMEPRVLDHLFEPFFTTKEVGKGTGLGLATVYGIVKQNDGFINVHSQVGLGTAFRIYLPRHDRPVAEIPGLGQAEIARGGETILIVEDSPMVLRLGTRMLDRLGYTVFAASGPGEAMRLAAEHAGEIDLLVTDVVMPEMSGRDLGNRLRESHPDLRCLFMSGYTANVIAHQGVLDDGVQFIQKPFSVAALAAKVREALEQTERPD